MRALVYDVKIDDVVHLLQHTREDKAAYLGEHSLIRLEEVAEPVVPFPDWVLIETRLCGICGSDTKQIFMDFEQVDSPLAPFATFPQTLGHEVVGAIREVGAKVRELSVGQRVVLNPWLSCAPRGIEPLCAACQEGQYSLCASFLRGRLAPGIHTGTSRDAPGGFAPLLPAHESMAIPVPDEISDEAAVLADPFAVSLHSVLRHPPEPGDKVVVYGCGTLGLCAIEILSKLFQVEIYAITRFEHQAKLATQLGALETIAWRPVEDIVEGFAEITGSQILRPVDSTQGIPMLHGPGGVRVVYNTVGSAESLATSVRIAGPRSTVVVSGVDSAARWESSPHYFKEVNLVGSNAFGVEEWGGVRKHAMLHYFDLIRERRIDVTPILTHRFALEDYRAAFAATHEQGESGAVKALFEFGADSTLGG